MGDDDETIIERLKGVVHTSMLDERLANVHLSRMELACLEGIIAFSPVSQMELARAEETIVWLGLSEWNACFFRAQAEAVPLMD